MLMTQADLEKHLQIDVTAEPDPVVTEYIAQASATVEAYCNQTLEESADTVTLEAAGDGESYLFLPRFPVTAVASVVEDDETLTTPDEYVWYRDGRIRRLNGIYDVAWSYYPDSVVVSYTAGWATIPNDLVLATTLVAAALFRNGAAYAKDGAKPVKSVTLEGSDSITYDTAAATAVVDGVTPNVKRLLTPYMRRQL